MRLLQQLLRYALLCCVTTGIALPAAAQTWLKIASGGYHTLALKSDGTVWAWGYNNYGQLGNGTTTTSSLPIQVSGLSNITDIGAGLSYSLAVSSNGKVYAWGRNNFGQLGDGTYNNSSTPVQVSGLNGITVTAIGGGQGHCLVLTSTGTVYAWGYNISGQLGNGTYNDSPTPVQVSGLSSISKIEVGYNQGMALKNDGTIYVWGYNGYGQLGLGNYNDRNVPAVLSLGTGITATAIAGRGFHSMAIGSDGKLYTWGRNDYGQLGNGNTTQTNIPSAITLPAGVTFTAIAGMYYHSIALGSDGKLYSWGRNDYGQLGNGTTSEAHTPVESNTGSRTIVSMTMGIYHNAILVAGQNEIYLAGDNSNKQLGNGANNTLSAVYVPSWACAQTNALPVGNSSATTAAPATGSKLTLLSECSSIVSVTPEGTNPVSGSLTVQGYLNGSAVTYNSAPYVRRYYDITPASAANTATATITLYFTQADFDDYNANRGNLPSLPTSTADAQGYKANLRISQQHGTSSTGAPGTFTGWNGSGPANELIIPASVTYNGTASRWEVTFPVKGFSGFFAHTTATNVPLPIRLISFSARKAATANVLSWNTAMEAAGSVFNIEQSHDGRSFSTIGSLAGKGGAGSYTFYDKQPLNGVGYYRLRIIAPGESEEYSDVIAIRSDNISGTITVSPIPAVRNIRITCNDALLMGQAAAIYDMQGRDMHLITLSADQYVDISGWPAGIYSLRLPGGGIQRIVKQ